MATWYFIEVSWSRDDGLSLYVNQQRLSHQPTGTYVPPEARRSMKMYVGRDDAGRNSYPAVTMDEMDLYYGDRQTLLDIDFIERGRPTNHHFSMDSISRGRLDHETMVVTLQGNPRVTDGKVGQAVELDGQDDVIDFGDRSNECFGNLDFCPHGVLVALWLRPEQLREKSYFVATGNNGVSLSYRDRKLKVMAATTSKTWEISTSDFAPDRWQFIEVSFHPDTGLRLYEGGRLVAESGKSEQRSDPAPTSYDLDRFYLGRGNVDMGANRHGAGVYDELDVWYADRDYLTSHGYVQRSRPDSVIVHFEESPDQRRVLHPTLDIRIIGRPRLVPGKVGNALELTGRGQYADLGTLSDTCMGNLAQCPQGVTLSAWMKFRSFENNMVFLSTGSNGLVMFYKDGLVTAPRFETERWYHVEISWHPQYGLKLYIDNELAGESPYTYTPEVGSPGGKFYVGRPNDGDIPGGRYTTGNFDIDELEVWYGRREDLLAFGYIDRDELGYEAFSMDSATGDRIDHTRYVVLLVNGARLVPGRQGQAVVLNGRGQYVDLGAHGDSCLGNLDLCDHGFTMSVWIKPMQLRDNIHFISAPSYALFYEDGQLKAEFNTPTRSWSVSTRNFRTDEWQRVTLAWHSKKGLTLYINDELMDTEAGVERLQSDQPISDKVYIGRTQADTRLTANMQADEVQVWYDYLDQLRATGQYQVEVSPQKITFDNFRDGYIRLRDRQIRLIGEVRFIEGLSRNSRAVYLNGLNQYLDMGNDFTCNGDLNTCRQGATLRFALYPQQLQDGMYFLDSFPVKLYYKDGRLYAEMQTSTRVWTVDTSEFRQGQMSRVELTWHPTLGLTMYVNGRRADYDTYPRNRTAVLNTDHRTYIGRPLNDADGTYANTVIDNLEFYNAYRNYIPEDTYLSLIGRPTHTPTTLGMLMAVDRA
nr:hypothetical protein BaRGS_006748 [Batillaria attramentaria]